MSNNEIAFLPVSNTQKNVFNFKELHKLLDVMIGKAAQAVITATTESESDMTEELVQNCIMEAIKDVYMVEKKKEKRKQASSAYILFCSSKRGEIKENNPDLDPRDITRLLGAEWKKLSDEEKKPFEEEHDRLAAELKKQYESGESSTETEVEKKKPSKEPKKPSKKEKKVKTDDEDNDESVEPIEPIKKKKEKKVKTDDEDDEETVEPIKKKKEKKVKSDEEEEHIETKKTTKKSEIKVPEIEKDDDEPLLDVPKPKKNKK